MFQGFVEIGPFSALNLPYGNFYFLNNCRALEQYPVRCILYVITFSCSSLLQYK